MLTISLIFILSLGTFIYKFLRKDRHCRLPPGPRGLPFLGNLFQLDKNQPFLTFEKWAQKFGDIYTVNMAGSRIIVVNDYKMVKELFSRDALSGRLEVGDITDLFEDGTHHGIINTEGEHWEQLRRFTLRQLRDFGFGSRTMESLIMDELKEVLEWIGEQRGRTVGGIKHKLSLAVVNSLWTILSGSRFQHNDPLLSSLTQAATKVMEEMAEKGGLIVFAPWLKHIIPERSGYKGFRRVMNGMRHIFSGALDEHKKTYDEAFQRDFIDAFLKKIKSCEDKDSAFFGELGERQLIAVIGDLFLAGSDTTSTTLDWIFLYLSTFSEVQEKLCKEIKNVVGSSRHCSLTDRPNLPYVEAFLSEVLRYSSIVPSGVGHKALSQTEYNGYSIPKGTSLIANTYHIHHSKKNWGDPEDFRPERFIGPDGAFMKHPALMPFSVGKRQCIGETLARETLFLYTTNIFQRYRVKFDEGDPGANPGLSPRPGFMLNPKDYKIIFRES